MPNLHAVSAAFSAADATLLYQVVESFEAAWQSGRPPSMDEFLPINADLRQAVLHKLVFVDLEYRLRAGEAIRVETYCARYPELASDHETVFELILWEYTLRRRQDPGVSAAEYRKRFPDFALPTEMAKPPAEATTLPPKGGGPHSTEPAASPRAAPAVIDIPGYEILGKLGEGGMGVVYKARHMKLGRLVALKMILAGDHARESELARFRTEAEAIARLQHPNIIQIFEIGEHEGKPFFSLEYCSGGTLSQKADGTTLQSMEAAKIIETLARAMHVAHEKGVIHRDLKPANVLLMNDGTPKITDFGLAKKLDDVGQTHSGAIMGTPSYMAPEQAAGKTKNIGPAVDVYALGAMLYELLTGRPPFKAATPMETIMQVLHNEPLPPSGVRAALPRDLETICLKALAKDPMQRYASALALANDLGRYQAGEPILARRHGLITRGWRMIRRHAGKVAAAVGVLAVTLALFVAMAARSDSQAAALQKEIVAALDEESIQGSDEYITRVETLITKLAEIDASQGEAATKKLWERLGQWVQKEIRIAPDVAEAKERLRPAIGWIDTKNPELAEGLRKHLEDRLDRWDPVFQLTEPFAEVATILPAGQFRVDDKSLQLIPLAKAGSPGLVLTTQASSRNSEARVVFGYPAWKQVGELGLAISSSKKSGYTFVLKSGKANDSSKPRSGAVLSDTDENLPDTVDDVHLQIRRNGVLLVQQKISAQSIGSGPIEIWAKREGMLLTCRLNQFQPLEFVDPFPLGAGDPGVFGLVAKDPVPLSRYSAYRKSLAAKPGPLDQGDALYEANQFEDAIQHYRIQAGLVSDPELIQQARYKEAVCLVESKRETEAMDLLKEVSIGAGPRWPALAECQLYLLLARRKDAVSQAEASMILDRLLARDQGQQSLLTLLPDETRSAMQGLDPSYLELFLATNKEKEHYVRAAKQRLALEKRLDADPFVLMHAENLLLMVYRLAGMEEEAKAFVDQRMSEQNPIATTMVTHYTWMLRRSGKAKEALSKNYYWQAQKGQQAQQAQHGILLERARIYVDLKNWTDAEKYLNGILQTKTSNPRKVLEALCMKGFLREHAGDLKGAQDAWKKGIEICHTIKGRPGDAFDQDVMRFMNYWIMASMAGDMTDEDCRGIQQFLLARNRGDAQVQLIAEAASSLIPPAVIRETWRTARGRDLAKKWVFRQASYAETGLIPVYLLNAETLHQLAIPGPLSPEHDQLIWDLVQNGSRAYFDGKLGKGQIAKIGLTFKISPFSPWIWAGVDKALDPSVRGPTAYLLGHRYLRSDVKQAETFFRTALSSAAPGSVLQRLAQAQLDKLKKG